MTATTIETMADFQAAYPVEGTYEHHELVETVAMPSEDALIGLDRALAKLEELLESARQDARDAGLATGSPSDLEACLRAARGWLMTVQNEIHLDAVANDR